jgi:hypothetical protein
MPPALTCLYAACLHLPLKCVYWNMATSDELTLFWKPFAHEFRSIALGCPELILRIDDRVVNSSCRVEDILNAPQGASYEFGNPRWQKWLEKELMPTMFKASGGLVKADFLGPIARIPGSKTELPKDEGLGMLAIFLPSECKGGTVKLMFDEREPIELQTTSPDELIAISWWVFP